MKDNWGEVNGIWRGYEDRDRARQPPDRLVDEVDAVLERMPHELLEFTAGGWVVVWLVKRISDHFLFMGRDLRQLRGWNAGEDERHTDMIYNRWGWRENGRIVSAVLIGSERYHNGRWLKDPRRSIPGDLAHELGHAFSMEAHQRRGLKVPYWRPDFRRTFLAERAAAPRVPELKYFTDQPWAVGAQETYAEAFAIATVECTGWGEREFRAAFPRCIDLVRRDIDAVGADQLIEVAA